MKKMEIILTDSTGRLVGKVEGYTVYDKHGKKVYEAKPETTIDDIVRILLSNSQKYVV